MRPLASRGTLVRARARSATRAPQPYDGPVAALTRARIEPSQRRDVLARGAAGRRPARDGGGPALALGIGEAPVGLQGTFCSGDDADALHGFAYGAPAARDAVRRTPQLGWYREELFARFAVSPRRVRSAASPSHRSPRLTPVPSQPVPRDVPRTCA